MVLSKFTKSSCTGLNCMLNHSELILGGQRSGKSRRAELLARDWLAQSPSHKAVMIATATAWDKEMVERIARHQQDRASRVPGMLTVEEPIELAQAFQTHSTPQTLVVVDCLTLWLTNLLMPYEPDEKDSKSTKKNPKKVSKVPVDQQIHAQAATLLIAIKNAPGPVVLVGNEIGLGVIPMGRETRAFVDALGRLNQEVAAVCARVTFMAAGLPLTLKSEP
jgi:adenosylcobinamide kinase/adenosylcobinamide-phosphate guanylyltransferase